MKKLNNNDLLEALKKDKAKKASQSLFDFINYTMPSYEAGWFNELVCRELDQFLIDVEQGNMPMLMLFAPPRSGKSEIGSRRFPAYALGKHPDWNIISTSYASDLANRMSRDTQRIIESPLYSDVFPNVKINGKNSVTVASGAIRTAELWEVIDKDGRLHGGSYRAAGVNGGITGQGMNIGIIDDPSKDYQQASSNAYQRAVMDWYDTTFMTRADPKINGILIILTRWHQLDLAGQLLSREPENCRVVSFPMVAEKDEVHTLNGKEYALRKEGEILFPERMPQKFVDKCKARGSLTWNALYQQRPTNRGGGVFKSEWLKTYRQLPKLKAREIFADTANKKGEHNDFSVFQLWGHGVDGGVYLIDMIRGKWEAHELQQRAIAFYEKHKSSGDTPIRRFNIEDKASGTGLIQNLKRLNSIPINGIPRNKDKVTRALDVQGWVENGSVFIPESKGNPWINDFIIELEAFTLDMSHAHDDQIDPFMDAINIFLNKRVRSIREWL